MRCRRREQLARQQAEEAAQREAERREAEAAAWRAREQKQRELRKLQQSFALRLEGNATISPPQKVMQRAQTYCMSGILDETAHGRVLLL